VETSHDLHAFQRPLSGVALAERHQARHLVLGQADLLAAEIGEVDVSDLEGRPVVVHGSLLNHSQAGGNIHLDIRME
jgi:hypothetical protein